MTDAIALSIDLRQRIQAAYKAKESAQRQLVDGPSTLTFYDQPLQPGVH